MKKLYFFLSLVAIFVGCASSEESIKNSNTIPSPINPIQYTPSQAKWETFYSKPTNAGNTSHDPDGIPWLNKASWDAAKWDGTTIYDPTKYSKVDFAKAICPKGDQIRGLREIFYANKPFKDNKNPTKAEVDEWHRIAINHLRALVGYTENERQVSKDFCMSARSLWGNQRQYTTQWDTNYPANGQAVFGPCVNIAGSPEHCGSTFVPSATDQIPFLPKDYATCGTPQGAEGISSALKSDIPWSIKFSRAICADLGTEGFWGGHVGPWFHREKFGFDFWDFDPANQSSNAVLRTKWTGQLMGSKYTEPK